MFSKNKFRVAGVAGVIVASLLGSSAIAAPIAYSLSDDGSTLVSFDIENPAGFSAIALSGDASALDAIDFRPLGGTLYGYDNEEDAFYTVDTTTGTLTLASVLGNTPTDTDLLDIDFNPTIDRLRIVTGSDQNIVYNPNDGTASDGSTTPLAYNAGDDNEGSDPTIAANGYTNSEFGDVTTVGTVQYVIDIELDILATLDNNAGTLNTIAGLTLDGDDVDVDENIGLDVFFSGGGDTAYLLLGGNDDSGLFTVDLGSGALTQVVDFSDPDFFAGDLTSLAVGPQAIEVPEPSTAIMLGFGLVGFGLYRRRSR